MLHGKSVTPLLISFVGALVHDTAGSPGAKVSCLQEPAEEIAAEDTANGTAADGMEEALRCLELQDMQYGLVNVVLTWLEAKWLHVSCTDHHWLQIVQES